MRVAVIGAGIIGVTTAVAVQDAFPYHEVQIFSEEFSPETTGDGSAGLWGPYLLGDNSPEKIIRWAGSTHRWLAEFWKTGMAPKTGVTLLPLYRLTSDPVGYSGPLWEKLVYGAHRLTPQELRKLNDEHKSNYTDGYFFLTYTGEPTLLLPWLTKKFIGRGGKVQRRKIHALHELLDDGYDLIINCTGLGSRELMGDTMVTPIRGQVFRAKAPWAMHGYIVDDDDGNYIIPNTASVVLGGTHQENDFDCTPKEEDSEMIYNGCCRMVPSLKGVSELKEWVGLRPGRPLVRLETEVLRSPYGKKFTVIHNYGHGGSGVTLCWGCALEVVELMRNMKRLKSSL